MLSLESISETFELPWWTAVPLAALFIVLCIMAFRRSGTAASLTALARLGVIIVIGWSAWAFGEHWATRERAAERRALDARAVELTLRAIAPGSALTCLDTNAGEAVESACEKALYASPESVAAATAYMSARLVLLADALEYANRADRGYETALAPVRRAIEADRFGFVAQVLAARDGCTSERCQAFALFQDAKIVQTNLRARTYENNVARFAPGWSEKEKKEAQASAPAPAPAPAAANAPVAVSTAKPIDFPSAASIPPVSIMNAEPVTPPETTARKPAPAPVRPAAPRPAGTVQGAPLPPPTAAAANPPRAQ